MEAIEEVEKEETNNEKEGNKSNEKCETQMFFEKHNFAKEFSQSWTIYIEKEKVTAWMNGLTKYCGSLEELQAKGFQFKFLNENGRVSYTLYDVMVPKMNIQGNQYAIRMFVMDSLPNIYKNVILELTPAIVEHKENGDIQYNCDVCDKKYLRLKCLKTHIESKHAPLKMSQLSPLIPNQVKRRVSQSQEVVNNDQGLS